MPGLCFRGSRFSVIWLMASPVWDPGSLNCCRTLTGGGASLPGDCHLSVTVSQWVPDLPAAQMFWQQRVRNSVSVSLLIQTPVKDLYHLLNCILGTVHMADHSSLFCPLTLRGGLGRRPTCPPEFPHLSYDVSPGIEALRRFPALILTNLAERLLQSLFCFYSLFFFKINTSWAKISTPLLWNLKNLKFHKFLNFCCKTATFVVLHNFLVESWLSWSCNFLT